MSKYDPSQEIVQMRAQWAKAENCKKMWHVRWSWLLDEQSRVMEECRKVREAAKDAMPRKTAQTQLHASLKPLPKTSNDVIGWLASKPEYALEIYTNWRLRIPVRAPDAWNAIDYVPIDERPSVPAA